MKHTKDALIYQAFGKNPTPEQKMLSREHLIEIIVAKKKAIAKARGESHETTLDAPPVDKNVQK